MNHFEMKRKKEASRQWKLIGMTQNMKWSNKFHEVQFVAVLKEGQSMQYSHWKLK